MTHWEMKGRLLWMLRTLFEESAIVVQQYEDYLEIFFPNGRLLYGRLPCVIGEIQRNVVVLYCYRGRTRTELSWPV